MNKRELVEKKSKLRRSYNSLNNLKQLVRKDKDEDFMLGVNKNVEDEINKKQQEYDQYKGYSQQYQKELKSVENDARSKKAEKDKMSKAFKKVYEETNLDKYNDENEKLQELAMILSDLKDQNHSLFGQLKEIEAENVSLSEQISISKIKLNKKSKELESENLLLVEEIKNVRGNIVECEDKYKERLSHKKHLELIYADIVSTVRNMIRYMNIEIDSSNYDIYGNEGAITHENILM